MKREFDRPCSRTPYVFTQSVVDCLNRDFDFLRKRNLRT